MLLRETTKDTFSTLARIIPYVENILKNKKVVKVFNEVIDINTENTDFLAQAYHELSLKALTILPVFLEENAEDVYMILAILNDTCMVDIENQSPLTTLRQVKDIFKDNELMGFLKEFME